MNTAAEHSSPFRNKRKSRPGDAMNFIRNKNYGPRIPQNAVVSGASSYFHVYLFESVQLNVLITGNILTGLAQKRKDTQSGKEDSHEDIFNKVASVLRILQE